MSEGIFINGKSVVSSDGETILESVEKAGISVHYECRSGFCGACKCKIISGDYEYIKETIAYLSDDEILICSSVPLTDIVLKTI